MAVYLHPADWRSVTTAAESSRWGGAYGLCTELLLTMLAQYVSAPERIGVFLEEGHTNGCEALQKLRNYQYDTEPMEWPAEVEVHEYAGESYELRIRDTAMRIGSIGFVAKRSCLPVQAADLLAYVAASTLAGTTGPFDDLWDG